MRQLIYVISTAFMINGSLFLDPAISKETLVPQKIFASAEDAVKALGTAYKSGDQKAVAEILGDKGRRLVSSGDPVIDHYERQWFLSLYKEGHEISLESDDRAVLQLGRDEYPYPIPIVKKAKGWRFDPSEGHEDLLSRRISKAELSALDVLLACVDAQREYFRRDHNGDGVLEYAQKFKSSAGEHDGLHWESKPGDAPSPIAPVVETAQKEGYKPAKEGKMTVYRGYFYKILRAQSAQAPGGAREYVVDGKMVGGFALAAFPVRYGVSGILTFIVNQDGKVYQKDLGPKTVAIGTGMTVFDPDESWTKGQ